MGSMRIGHHEWTWVLLGMFLWSTQLHIVADDVKVLAYWESMLHGASMPASIRTMLTPLNSLQTAQLVININATNEFLPTHAAYFCKAARIQCYQVQDIIFHEDTKLISDQEIFVYHADPSADQEISVYHADPSADQEISVYHADPSADQEISVYHGNPTFGKYHIQPVQDRDISVSHMKPPADHDHKDRTKSVNPISQKAFLSHPMKHARVLTSNIAAAPGAIFFREHKNLVRRAEVQINLSGDDGDIVDKRAFLPRELAQFFPFKSGGLPTIAHMLQVSEDALQRTMAHCDTENDVMIGETRACLTSIEDLADFASSIMGSNRKIKVSEATSDLGMRPAEKKFIVLNVTTLNDDAASDCFISCHDLYFPFRVFFCHKTKQTKYFSVTLQAKDGRHHDRIAICHYDTSYWDPNHPSFSELHTRPGQSEACHWMGKNNWLFMYA